MTGARSSWTQRRLLYSVVCTCGVHLRAPLASCTHTCVPSPLIDRVAQECNEGYGLVGGACRLCRQPGCAQCDRNPRRCRECITRSWWNGSAWVVPMLDSERRRCHLFRYYDLYPGTPN